MESCLTAANLDGLAAGTLDPASTRSFQDHVAKCERCRAAYESHVRETEHLAGAVTVGADRWQAETAPSAAPGEKVAPRVAAAPRYERLPQIEGYEIIRVVGHGGMGVVYEAMQRKFDRRVALKLLPAVVGSVHPESVARFRREASAAAQLHHTHIIPIYDIGESREGCYYAMELIDGQPLSELIKRFAATDVSGVSTPQIAELIAGREIPGGAETGVRRGSGGPAPGGGFAPRRGRAYYRQAATWIADAADALHYAHQRNMIHRDIKPGNLMLSTTGRIVVLDFGLVKMAGEESVTVTGSLVGTYRYMSPEQVGAKRVPVDTRTDIYSLGATLYELLTFVPVFAATERGALLSQILFHDPTPPRKVNPSVPVELQTVCQKAMEKSPDARYATAREMAEDLRRYAIDLPIVARAPGLISRAVKFVRRRKTPVIAISAAVLLAVTGAMLGVSMKRERAERALRRAQHVRQLIKDGMSLAKEGTWEAAETALNEALEMEPDNVNAVLSLAWMKKEYFNSATGRTDTRLLEEADGLCRQALRIDPDNILGLNTHGVILKKLGRHAEAIAAYQRVTDLRPNWYAAWVNLGTIHAVAGNLRVAEKHLRKSTELAPVADRYAVDTWRNLASLQLYFGGSEAAEAIENALKCNRDDVASWIIRARLRLQLEGYVDVQEALDDAKYADRLADGRDAKAKRIRALAHLRSKEYEKAAEQAGQAIELRDLSSINHLAAAIARARLGETDRAQNAYAEAVAAWPAELQDEGSFIATAEAGVLWIDGAAELMALRAEAEALLGEGAGKR